MKIRSQAKFLFYVAKLVFTQLRQAFTQTPILYHFELECYTHMRLDSLEYVIGSIPSQPTLDQQFSDTKELQYSKSDSGL